VGLGERKRRSSHRGKSLFLPLSPWMGRGPSMAGEARRWCSAVYGVASPVATRVRDWGGRTSNDVKRRFCPLRASRTTGQPPRHSVRFLHPPRHVPAVPDNRDPGEAGPHISGSGRIRGLSQRSPGNQRCGPCEQETKPDRTARITGSKKQTATERPRHQNGRSGLRTPGLARIPPRMFLLDMY
jgi:hypothetical protein